MALITLTTEWREDDYFHGILRGKLSSLCPEAVVITNASSVPPLNIMHGAFVVRNTFIHYPPGTVHLLFISSEATGERPHLLVSSRDHWFVGADNGIFNLILNSPPDRIISLDNPGGDDEISLFAATAAALVRGADPGLLGKEIAAISERVPLRAAIDRNVVIGSVIFIDSYGNAITNITREIFSRVFEGRPFRVLIKSNKYHTEKISRAYSDEPVGELVSRFNILDLLEISVNGANISQLLGIETGDAVRVELRENKGPGNGLF